MKRFRITSLFALSLVLVRPSVAATYTYNPVDFGPDTWAAGTHWNGAGGPGTPPVGAVDTSLIFTPVGGTFGDAFLINQNVNDIPGLFALNSMALQGNGPVGDGFVVDVTINGLPTSPLNFISNGLTAPSLILSANNGVGVGSSVTYRVVSDILLNNTLEVSGNGTANFVLGGAFVAINGAAGITKTGTSTLTLDGTNLYTGPTTINGGTVKITAAANLGAGTLIMGGGTLQSAAGLITLGVARTLNLTAESTLQVDAGSTLTVDGQIFGGGFGLTKTGNGELVLANNGNFYNGSTKINGGKVRVTAAANLGDGSGTNSVVFGGGTLVTSANLVLGAARGVVVNAAGGTLETETGALLTVDGLLSGAGALTKAGAGTLVLNGSSIGYTGNVLLGGGIVQMGSGNALGTSGDITFSGGTLQLTAGSAGSLSAFSGRFKALNGVDYTLDTGGQNAVLSTVLPTAGGSGFTKLGLGELTLSGANLYAGVTNLNAGAVRITSPGNLGDATSPGNLISFSGGTLIVGSTMALGPNRNIALNSNGTVQTDTGVTLTVDSLIVGSGALIKTGPGTLVLSTAGASTGGLTIADGIAVAGAAGSLPLGPLVLGDPTGTSGKLALTSDQTVGSLATAGGTANAVIGGSATISTLTVNVPTGSTTYAGNLGGALLNENNLALTKAGNGTLTLTGTNTATGLTTLAGGTLSLGSAGALGSGNITFTGGTLQYSVTNTADLASKFVNSTTAPIKIDVNGQTVTYASSIGASNTAGFTLTGTGGGTLILNAPANYTGLTTVTSGTLQYGVQDALGSGDVTVNGGTLALGAFNDTVGTIILDGGSITGTGTLTSTQPFDLRNGLISANLNGAVAVNKTTTGTVILSGMNTYTGGTLLSAGVLQIGSAGALGTTGSITFAGGALQVNSTTASLLDGMLVGGRLNTVADAAFSFDTNGESVLFTNPILVSGLSGLTKSGNGTLTLSVPNTYAGPTTINGGRLAITDPNRLGNASLTNTIVFGGGTLATAGTFAVGRAVSMASGNGIFEVTGAADILTVDGVVSGAGNLAKAGPGFLTLAASNTYTGTTIISGGQVNFTIPANLGLNTTVGGINMSGNAILNSTAATAVDMTRGITLTGPASVVSNTVAAIPDAGTPSAVTNMLRFTGVETGTGNILTIGGPGNTSINGNINGTGGITKIGNGTLLLTGGGNYSGGLNAAGGKVIFNANGALGAATNPITLSGGVILQANNGNLSTGTTRPITLTGNATFRYTANTADSMQFPGPINIGTNTLSVDVSDTQASGKRILISGVITGSGIINKIGGTVNQGAGATSVEFSNANPNFTGTVNLAVGVIRLTNANALQAATLNLSNANTTLELRNNAAVTFNTAAINITADVRIGVRRTDDGGGGLTLSLGAFNVGANTISVLGRNNNGSSLAMGVGTQTVAGTTTFTTAAPANINGSDWNKNNTSLTLAGFNSAAGGISTLAFTGAGPTTVGAITQGAGNVLSLTKSGAGALTLTAPNNYSGPTTINGGSVTISNATSLGDASATNVISMNNGTLVVTATTTLGPTRTVAFMGGTNVFQVDNVVTPPPATVLTVDGVISGATPFRKTGTGTLLLTGANALTGTTVVANGIVQLDGGDNRLSTGALTLGEAATSGKLILGGATVVHQTVGGLGTAGTGTANSIVGGNVAVSTLTVNAAANATYAGTIGGAGLNENNIALVKSGTGTVVLSGANTYTGGTTLAAGILQTDNATGLGTTGTIVFSGGTLQFSANSAAGASTLATRFTSTANSAFSLDTNNQIVTLGTAIGVSGLSGLSKSGGGTLVLTVPNTYVGATTINGGILSITAANQLGDATSINNTLAFGGGTLASTGSFALGVNRAVALNTGGGTFQVDSGTLTVDGVISGFSELRKTGTGTLLLTGGAISNGGSVIANGVVQLDGGDNRLPAGGVTLGDASNTSGKLILGGANAVMQTVASLSTVGTGTGNSIVGGNAAISVLTVNGVNAAPFAGTIGGAGLNENNIGLSKDGASTLILSGVNTYTGPTTLVNGILQPDNANALGTGAIVFNGGTFQLSANSVAAASSFASRFTSLNDKAYNLDTNGLSVTLTNPIGASGASGLTKLGAGTLNLTVANTYTGATNINGGVLHITASNQLGAGNALGLAGGTLATNAVVTNARTTTLNVGGGTFLVEAGGALTMSGVISGATPLNKTGPGELILTQINTFTGTTNVNSGQLTLAPGATLGDVTYSPVVVNSTGILAGGSLVSAAQVGTISVNAGGILAPGIGSALGQINVHGDLLFVDTSVFNINLNTVTPSADIMTGVVNLTLAGNVQLVGSDSGPGTLPKDTAIKLINYTGFWSGGLFFVGGNPIEDYDGVTETDQIQIGNSYYRIDYNFVDLGAGTTSVALIVVPEPGAVAMLCGGLGLLMGARRRRKA